VAKGIAKTALMNVAARKTGGTVSNNRPLVEAHSGKMVNGLKLVQEGNAHG
jgi:hypothetical protein